MSDKEIKSVNGTKEKVLSGLFWTFCIFHLSSASFPEIQST